MVNILIKLTKFDLYNNILGSDSIFGGYDKFGEFATVSRMI